MSEKVKLNETVALIDSSNKRYLLVIQDNTDKFKGIGVFNPSSLVGKKYGNKCEIGNKSFWLFRPSLQDKLLGIKRKAQIILPKDSAQILMNCSISSGQKVLEVGIGSGSLTIALANAVAPDGKVISYDNRDDFIKHAIKNLEMAGLDKYVTAKLRDISNGIDEKELDAVIVDIPNPWDGVGYAWKKLKAGGYFCSYSPLISQVEKTFKEINKHNFIDVKTIENIQREMIVSERGTRPSFEMLGHTGYLTFARKVL